VREAKRHAAIIRSKETHSIDGSLVDPLTHSMESSVDSRFPKKLAFYNASIRNKMRCFRNASTRHACNHGTDEAASAGETRETIITPRKGHRECMHGSDRRLLSVTRTHSHPCIHDAPLHRALRRRETSTHPVGRTRYLQGNGCRIRSSLATLLGSLRTQFEHNDNVP